MSFLEKLHSSLRQNLISAKYATILKEFYTNYLKEVEAYGHSKESCEERFAIFLDLILEQIKEPHRFSPYHAQIRSPFDYYTFGMDFFSPLVDLKASYLLGIDHLKEIDLLVKNKDNVILLANHQIEADPQAISLLVEPICPKLAEKMIFLAGERVITDPLAIPFSLGRNLLCIYSKRYIDKPIELKMEKQLHNKRTMELMGSLLSEGGKIIYVAPSGGRDRMGQDGTIEVAKFDPQSIEMLYLMARKASSPTFFYTLALKTYSLLPPPETIQLEIGEARIPGRGGVKLHFGSRIDMEHFPGNALPDKHERRAMRAEHIWNQVMKDYESLAIGA